MEYLVCCLLEFYFMKTENPNTKLGIGKYIIDVHITASNAEKSFRFILKNRGRRFKDVSIKGPYKL